MRRFAILTVVLAVLAGSPAHAKVKVVQGVVAGKALFTLTSQREVHMVVSPGQPARLMGRLPRKASGLVSDGMEAWAVTVGEQRTPEVRLFQVHPTAQVLLEIHPTAASIGGRIRVDGVAGADDRYVYLLPDTRLDRQSLRLERGHLPAFPELRVTRALRRGPETWYVARDAAPGDGIAARQWLLHARDQAAVAPDDAVGWLRVEAGEASGPVDLHADEHSLFLVFEQGRILRFDSGSLRLVEDLSPMLHPGSIRFFAAGERFYWVGLQSPEKNPDSNGETARRVTLWQIDREALDGGVFRAADVPDGFAPLQEAQGRIWFGATEKRDAAPLIAVTEADGVSRPYAIRGLHARRWHAVGQGMEDAGILVAEGSLVAVVVGVLTLPVWIWFV